MTSLYAVTVPRILFLFLLSIFLYTGCAVEKPHVPVSEAAPLVESLPPLTVLPDTIYGFEKHDMMKQFLLTRADLALQEWKSQYEQRKTPEQITAYQKHLRDQFIEALGGLPPRTPLQPQITGIIQRSSYQVEKVIFESQPNFYVTAALFIPKANRFTPPYPAVLVPCGHAHNAKACEPYQSMGALLALNGMVSLVFDPIEQGERLQTPDEQGGTKYAGVPGHLFTGIGSSLLGRNTARFEIWDCMRAIDYLQSRPEVDPDRIGVTGNSGGGTQTSYLMALDNRIRAAAPSCYLTGFEKLLHTIGPQDAEQNIAGQLAFGMDHPDYLMMQAPMPILICAATRDFFDIEGTWNCFRYAKRLYSRMGFAERIDLLENDAEHNYSKNQREGVARWMARWLQGRDEPITEPNLILLTEKEILCTPTGRVMDLENNRTVYQLNQEYENELAQKRKTVWADCTPAQLLAQVRTLAGIRSLPEIPEPNVDPAGVIQRDGYRIEKFILRPEKGICLPLLRFVPEASPHSTVLYINEAGNQAAAAPDGPLDQIVRTGQMIFAVELRGTGETRQTAQSGFGPALGTDWQDVLTAYLLGLSYVGMRAEDILTTARIAKNQSDTASLPLYLIAVGNVAVPALHAAALEPHLFDTVQLQNALPSWFNLISVPLTKNQLVNTVHGALQVYDLPNLASLLADKLTITDPLDPAGNPIPPEFVP